MLFKSNVGHHQSEQYNQPHFHSSDNQQISRMNSTSYDDRMIQTLEEGYQTSQIDETSVAYNHLEYHQQYNNDNYQPEVQQEQSYEAAGNVLQASPATQPRKDSGVIDYNTLNNPKSFLYSQERTKVMEIYTDGGGSNRGVVNDVQKTKDNRDAPNTIEHAISANQNPVVVNKESKISRRRAPAPPTRKRSQYVEHNHFEISFQCGSTLSIQSNSGNRF